MSEYKDFREWLLDNKSYFMDRTGSLSLLLSLTPPLVRRAVDWEDIEYLVKYNELTPYIMEGSRSLWETYTNEMRG